MLNFAITEFSEVRVSLAQHPRAHQTQINCLQVLSRLPHNIPLGMPYCSAAPS
jgi:hypothetical protein